MNRRECLALALGTASAALAKTARPIPAIDTHVHLYDPSRPQGVPWPSKDDKILYQTTLPDRYRQVTAGLGVVGLIEVECSPWFEDNQWVLDLAAHDSIIVGTVGHLDPGEADFCKRVEQLHRNPLFRGIRHGYPRGQGLSESVSNPQFISNLKCLADAGLEWDTVSLNSPSLAAVVRLTDRIPSLRVVLDHLGLLESPQEISARSALQASLRELGKRSQVYAKVSEVVHPIGGRVRYDLDFYRSRLDELWDTFGPDRVFYGSDWPVSDHAAPFGQELKVVREYVESKGTVAANNFFWKNSLAAYRWVKRAPSQPPGLS
jgi:predicted TIM-barrel fold metal-dependent hydrolase